MHHRIWSNVCFCVYCTWKKNRTYVRSSCRNYTYTLLQIFFTIALLLCDSMCMTLWYHAKKLSYFWENSFLFKEVTLSNFSCCILVKENARGFSYFLNIINSFVAFSTLLQFRYFTLWHVKRKPSETFIWVNFVCVL